MSQFEAQGWVLDGVMHLLPGVTLEEAHAGVWGFTGKVVDSEGRVLKEAEGIEEGG